MFRPLFLKFLVASAVFNYETALVDAVCMHHLIGRAAQAVADGLEVAGGMGETAATAGDLTAAGATSTVVREKAEGIAVKAETLVLGDNLAKEAETLKYGDVKVTGAGESMEHFVEHWHIPEGAAILKGVETAKLFKEYIEAEEYYEAKESRETAEKVFDLLEQKNFFHEVARKVDHLRTVHMPAFERDMGFQHADNGLGCPCSDCMQQGRGLKKDMNDALNALDALQIELVKLSHEEDVQTTTLFKKLDFFTNPVRRDHQEQGYDGVSLKSLTLAPYELNEDAELKECRVTGGRGVVMAVSTGFATAVATHGISLVFGTIGATSLSLIQRLGGRLLHSKITDASTAGKKAIAFNLEKMLTEYEEEFNTANGLSDKDFPHDAQKESLTEDHSENGEKIYTHVRSHALRTLWLQQFGALYNLYASVEDLEKEMERLQSAKFKANSVTRTLNRKLGEAPAATKAFLNINNRLDTSNRNAVAPTAEDAEEERCWDYLCMRENAKKKRALFKKALHDVNVTYKNFRFFFSPVYAKFVAETETVYEDQRTGNTWS